MKGRMVRGCLLLTIGILFCAVSPFSFSMKFGFGGVSVSLGVTLVIVGTKLITEYNLEGKPMEWSRLKHGVVYRIVFCSGGLICLDVSANGNKTDYRMFSYDNVAMEKATHLKVAPLSNGNVTIQFLNVAPEKISEVGSGAAGNNYGVGGGL